MERAISHDDAARTSILKPEKDGYRKGRREIKEEGQKESESEKKDLVCVCLNACVSIHALMCLCSVHECVLR